MKLSSLPWLHWSNAVWDNLRHRFAMAKKRLSLILRMRRSLPVSSQTYSGLRRFGDSERVVNAAIARLRGAKSTGLLVVKSEAALGMGNLEEAHAALDSIHDKDDMDYQAARLRLYLIERDYSGAKAFAAKATDEAKKMPDFWLTLAAVAHAEGNVNEERQAYAEAKRLALLALVPRPDDPRLLGELAIAEAGLGENEEALRHARQRQPRYFR